MTMKDKVVVVTGAGRGIGRELALAFAREGADLVLTSRTESALQETQAMVEEIGQKGFVVTCDVSQAHSVQNMAEQTLAHYGHVDVLVNNSGIGGPSAETWKIEPEDWAETFDINVKGTYLCCRAFLPSMIERQSGNIVIIGSMTGKRPLWGRSPYAASKMALVGLARTLALETGPYDIRVNVVSPGAVEGERIAWVIQQQAEGRGITPEQAREELASGSPLNRLVPASDVAAAALYLASDRSGSTTGEDLNVSAGLVSY
ncbi:MAG: SDR family NAD(P)-dependent oxidoreductase [Chloroflexi bacterium]|nr:SDR family NAD(P)-dependent oxidoreductase [Chloroflexota bacterium]MDA1228126.1 SDR family NAD(P)-dependent oxidoreductase [Chloroflexota bacterium]